MRSLFKVKRVPPFSLLAAYAAARRFLFSVKRKRKAPGTLRMRPRTPPRLPVEFADLCAAANKSPLHSSWGRELRADRRRRLRIGHRPSDM